MAQEQKIGYVDTDYILSNMPEYQGVQQQLRSISSDWNNKLEQLKDEIDQLKEDFQAKEILYTDELRAQKQQEIQDKIRQRQQYMDQKFGEKGEYFQKQKELLEPIQRKVFNAINTVAQRQNFDFVFDRAQNSNMLYSLQKWNLNDKVLQELGITLKEASN
ncbi:MAG: OmpH family outer membrane protein [Balneolaceae bacterium]|jgi:outer membrane protein